MNAIAKSRDVPLEKFIMALGSNTLAPVQRRILRGVPVPLSTLMGMSKEQLLSIEGIGDIVATSIMDYFNDTAMATRFAGCCSWAFIRKKSR